MRGASRPHLPGFFIVRSPGRVRRSARLAESRLASTYCGRAAHEDLSADRNAYSFPGNGLESSIAAAMAASARFRFDPNSATASARYTIRWCGRSHFAGEPSARVERVRRFGEYLNSFTPILRHAAAPTPFRAIPQDRALQKPSACRRVVGEGRMSRAIPRKYEFSFADSSGCCNADAVSGDRFRRTKLCRCPPQARRPCP